MKIQILYVSMAVGLGLLSACADEPVRRSEGYVLFGTLKDGASGEPIAGVRVLNKDLVPLDTVFYDISDTDENGEFRFQKGFNDSPKYDLFRFEKIGYLAKEVPGTAAVRSESHWRLVVSLDRENGF